MTLSKKLISEFESILNKIKTELFASLALEDLADIQITAKEEFNEAAEKIDDLSEVADAESLIAELRYISLEDGEANDIIDYVCETNGVKQVMDYLQSKGYAIIKMQTQEQEGKLREFIESEIYPSWSERKYWSI